MYPIPTNEILIETKVCRQCNSSFSITDKDMEFYEKVSPVFGGKRYSIPTPTFCPDCRQQRRLSFRNERKLYKRKCDATGKDIVSIYSPDKPFKVYHHEYWWSDSWDPIEYGKEFDFSKGFFEQFRELNYTVPQLGLVVTPNVENSQYTNYTDSSKNIYMCSDVFHCSDTYYSTTIKYLNDCSDCLDLQKSQDAYECTYSEEVFNSKYLNFCHTCLDSFYLDTCYGVSASLFCVGIKNKKHYLLNESITEGEYKSLISQPIRSLYEKYGNLYRQLQKQRIRPEKISFESERCTGDNFINSKSAYIAFDVTGVEDVKYVLTGYEMSDVMDTSIHNIDCSFDYEAICGGKLKHSAFNVLGWGGFEVYYNFLCIDSSHLFGCVGLRNKSYCILNKQYTKEEYEVLVPRIIEHMMKTGEWGEFFPSSLSPFGYNETVVMEYFPLSRKEVLENSPCPPGSSPGEALGQGGNETFLHGPIFNWSDYESPFPTVEKIIPGSKLPDSIESIPDDILNWAIECEVTGRPFRIIKQELEFYRKHNLPIPRRHPDQRHLDRMALRNPRKLYERVCDKCQKEMMTTYSPERPEKVYCEECYNKEVIG